MNHKGGIAMENAADALKMAAAVLLFVLAISVAIYSFGQVRETADVILDYRDRETVYIDGDYYYKGTETEERQVGVDTIIPTIPSIKVVFWYILKSSIDFEIRINKIFPPKIAITAPKVW